MAASDSRVVATAQAKDPWNAGRGHPRGGGRESEFRSCLDLTAFRTWRAKRYGGHGTEWLSDIHSVGFAT
jgi:hypothetical protein